MNSARNTWMGGSEKRFKTTHWTEILAARTKNGDRRRRVIEYLLAKYWKPVYCYLRRKGYDNETAKDLTQGFFEEVVLGRSLVQSADEAKGRFRSFLLIALDRYCVSWLRKHSAVKRRPSGRIMSLDAGENNVMSIATSELSPEQALAYAWAAELVREVIAEVQADCLRDGKRAHWEVFRRRVLTPKMEQGSPDSVPALCEELGIDRPQTVSNMVVTVKRRFRLAMRRRVRRFVESERHVDAEIRSLMDTLSRSRASWPSISRTDPGEAAVLPHEALGAGLPHLSADPPDGLSNTTED